MAISINGTSGISGVDGSAATPALQGSDSNTGISFGTDEVNINTGGTTRATVDSGGRLLVGTSSTSVTSTVLLQGTSGAPTGPSSLWLTRGSTPANENSLGDVIFSDNGHGAAAFLGAYRDGGTWTSGSSQPTRLSFSTTADGSATPIERTIISRYGGFITQADGSGTVDHFFGTVGAAADNATLVSFRCAGTLGTPFSGTAVCGILRNGNVRNTNNSYGSLSDIKLKENIVDATSQWDDIKGLRLVNYNFKEETGYETFKQLGLIAQEVEQVCPNLVAETPDTDDDGKDLGTTTKSVNYSVLYMKAVGALQEALTRIEQLETKVAALEGGAN
jgi:hypothetical protein